MFYSTPDMPSVYRRGSGEYIYKELKYALKYSLTIDWCLMSSCMFDTNCSDLYELK